MEWPAGGETSGGDAGNRGEQRGEKDPADEDAWRVIDGEPEDDAQEREEKGGEECGQPGRYAGAGHGRIIAATGGRGEAGDKKPSRGRGFRLEYKFQTRSRVADVEIAGT